MSNYPLHEELKRRSAERTAIQNFLDWLDECEFEICQQVQSSRSSFIRYESVRATKEAIIARFMEIDLKEFHKEKDRMVEEMRKGT